MFHRLDWIAVSCNFIKKTDTEFEKFFVWIIELALFLLNMIQFNFIIIHKYLQVLDLDTVLTKW